VRVSKLKKKIIKTTALLLILLLTVNSLVAPWVYATEGENEEVGEEVVVAESEEENSSGEVEEKTVGSSEESESSSENQQESEEENEEVVVEETSSEDSPPPESESQEENQDATLKTEKTDIDIEEENCESCDSSSEELTEKTLVVENPPESSEPDREEDSGEEEAKINTGDAASLAEAGALVNGSQTEIPGQMSGGQETCAPPLGETDCSQGVIVSEESISEVSEEATAAATTGENLIAGNDGEAEITTGEATAAATVANQVNTNIAEFVASPSATTEEETDEKEESPENPEEEDVQPVIISNDTVAVVDNGAEVLAQTGDNQIQENGGEATIKTGDALAYANIVNLINTNLIGSSFGLYLLDLLEGGQGDINLNEWWKEINRQEGLQIVGEEGFDLFLVHNVNLAELHNQVEVAAVTGENEVEQNQGEAKIETGEATAMANVVNLVNLNLVGSKFLLPVINIFDSFEGDLILPRPERFLAEEAEETSSPPPATLFANDNLAVVENEVQSAADSGHNVANNVAGNNSIKTGESESQSNIIDFLNQNIQSNRWFYLLINALGNWSGRIFGWSAPQAVEERGEGGTFSFAVSPPEDSVSNSEEELSDEEEEISEGEEGVVINQNEAYVQNDVQVLALTGENQVSDNEGKSEIITGKAKSLANLVDLINVNIWGSRWFLGLINILGNWQGDIVFAYPDVTISLTDAPSEATVGETVKYGISFANKGVDEAHGVEVVLELPEGTSYLADNSGLPVKVASSYCRWQVGNLAPGEAGSFEVILQIDEDISWRSAGGFWAKIITPVYAAEESEQNQLVLVASIATSDPESDLSNNKSLAVTSVYFTTDYSAQGEDLISETGEGAEGGGKGGVDPRQPILVVTAKNNVGEFVYPGDTVTFEVTVENISDVPAYDAYLSHALYDGLPQDFGVAHFALGTIQPGQRLVLTFGMYLADHDVFSEGDYRTVTQAVGFAPDGSEVVSPEAITYFKIKLREVAGIWEVRAAGKEEETGEVLSTTDAPRCPPSQEDILPYLLLFMLSSLGLIDRSKRILRFKEEWRERK